MNIDPVCFVFVKTHVFEGIFDKGDQQQGRHFQAAVPIAFRERYLDALINPAFLQRDIEQLRMLLE